MKRPATKTVLGAGALIIGGILAGSLVTGCGAKAQEPFKDAGVTGHDNGKALIIEMPDGFSNLATKCVGHVRYTVAFHGDHAYGSVTTLAGPGNGC